MSRLLPAQRCALHHTSESWWFTAHFPFKRSSRCVGFGQPTSASSCATASSRSDCCAGVRPLLPRPVTSAIDCNTRCSASAVCRCTRQCQHLVHGTLCRLTGFSALGKRFYLVETTNVSEMRSDTRRDTVSTVTQCLLRKYTHAVVREHSSRHINVQKNKMRESHV
jgi:hypothetical protein